MSKGTLIYDCPMYGMKSGDEIEMVNFDNLLKIKTLKKNSNNVNKIAKDVMP